jgi:hypothetical protein
MPAIKRMEKGNPKAKTLEIGGGGAERRSNPCGFGRLLGLIEALALGSQKRGKFRTDCQ